MHRYFGQHSQTAHRATKKVDRTNSAEPDTRFVVDGYSLDSGDHKM